MTMSNTGDFVLNFQQFIQLQTVLQGYPFFTGTFNLLFDEDFYLGRYPDVARALEDNLIGSAEQHFLSSGVVEGRIPHAFFDEDLYLLANPDVKAVVESGAIASGLQHYVASGFNEGRDSLGMSVKIGGIQMSNLFDEDFYLNQFSDIDAAVKAGGFSYGYEHFLRFGVAEGRSPSLYYDEALYLNLNPDVKNAVDNGAFQSGLEHYLLAGHIENRTASLLFNAQAYLDENPDVADVIGGGLASAFEHYINFGLTEGREPSTLLFDEQYYLAQDSNVADAVAAGFFQSGYQHFLRFGMKEGRKPNADYSEESYLAANPDVEIAIGQGAFSNGIEHYILFGRNENRSLAIAEQDPLDYSDSSSPVLVDLAKHTASFLNYGVNFKVMPLGDSNTEGWDEGRGRSRDPLYSAAHEGYREDLWDDLEALGVKADFVGSLSNGPTTLEDKDHEGHAGAPIGFIRSNITTYLSNGSPDIVLLMIGTNNGGSPGETIANELNDLINDILSNGSFSGTLMVSTVPPIVPAGRFPDRVANIEDYNSRVQGVVQSFNSDRVVFVNAGGQLTLDDMADISVDGGLHPNQTGYAKIADAWYDAILDNLVASRSAINAQDVAGSAFADALLGDSRANVLEGREGDDSLTGGGGSDEFVYRSLEDGFDTINDFGADDIIKVVDASFEGDLSAGFDFVIGSAANTGNSKPAFFYDNGTGILSYDPVGNAGSSAAPLLQLKNAPALVGNQIVVA
ncbi:GDSL-type esterase/lipase family protein [Oscillatoria sp. CS-180]|uniref:GDSL-type esterase/lipase family protein n=1 Tax=Oscillatoria sp. CS-180 TaxID=3021720 RepID=UPI00232B1F88|nr:GDSL-type esterase/lipase family protein [Oscillatoria sp. CS-180]MDB9529518.1 GDSL-type esterase/lipase family protein [Oscillatoria sp. CS-180]